MKDPIVEEVRRAREQYAAKHEYDVHAIAQDARRTQGKRGRKIIRGPKQKVARAS